MRVLITNTIPDKGNAELILSPSKGDDVLNLDKYLDHNECQEIVCEITDYIPASKIVQFVTNLCAKLAHKGRLIISGTDGLSVTKKYYHGEINSLEFNTLVYGERNEVWAFKQGLFSLNDILEIVKLPPNMKIIQKRISDTSYSITGERE